MRPTESQPPDAPPAPSTAQPMGNADSRPERPRLGIVHLLIWTACVALYLGLLRAAIRNFSPTVPNADSPWMIVAAVAAIFASLGSGASLGGLALWADCRRRGWRFPVHPGEYLMAMRGVSALLQTLAFALLASVDTKVYGGLIMIPLAIQLGLVEFMSPFLVAGHLAVKPWPTFLFLRGWGYFLCLPPLGQMALFVALPILAWTDHRRGRRYPWPHWLGVALEMWWLVLSAFLFLGLGIIG